MMTYTPYPPERAAYYLSRGYWTSDTFADFFAHQAQKYPHHTALVAQDSGGDIHRSSYLDLNTHIEATAAFFAESGINNGDFVVVQLPNIYEFAVTIGALFHLGALPVFALPAHRGHELRHFISQSKATALVCAAEFQGFNHAALADSLREEFPTLTVIIASPHEDHSDNLYLHSGVWLSGATYPRHAVDALDLAFLQVSGGTTGTPKLIPRTHADYLYSVRESALICSLDEHTRFLVILPVSHNFTMSSPGVLGVWLKGGTVVFCTDPSPSTAFKIIAHEAITMTSLVPPLALAWLAVHANTKPDLSSLEILQVGGAKFSSAAASRIGPELGCQLQQVFGMAEGLVNYTRYDDPPELVTTTQGRPISADDEIRIIDDSGQPVAPGEPGILLTRGPYTINSYFNGADPDSFSPDGFYITGDIVRQLPTGHLIVEGRSKDQINRGGEKISAEDIENHLITHPLIRDAALVGVADDMHGEKTCAFIVREVLTTDTELSTSGPSRPSRPSGLSAAELRQYLRNRGVASYKIPDFFEFAQEFPHTGVGKTSRKELRALVLKYIQSTSESTPSSE
ncbi:MULTISPECIES: (2,3-dihydroxybenzoyl)adenylate synthase [unclassified Corynebacterium]|uniref:(2,3-dihydroxybenzoyl)adenylate synthase n=1 Tax=unclassified Corynebacterium TaxID=2624378 RepID=UPI002169F0D0|nr:MULTISPECIES: AMP-binding protein [unclassified Corynebacterium]MCS4489637.1 AMP-binding protein [Corynebacterium sp. ES2775-CONJ]MCS4531548.1 AMP-binding protein [Corynebacterium sp. ES2730-CONJ]